jgi:hypothetical protein
LRTFSDFFRIVQEAEYKPFDTLIVLFCVHIQVEQSVDIRELTTARVQDCFGVHFPRLDLQTNCQLMIDLIGGEEIYCIVIRQSLKSQIILSKVSYR